MDDPEDKLSNHSLEDSAEVKPIFEKSQRKDTSGTNVSTQSNASSKPETDFSVLCEQVTCPTDSKRDLSSSESTQSTSFKSTNCEVKHHLSRDELNLSTLVQMSDLAIELKEKSLSADKYVAYLRSLVFRATKTVMGMKNTSRGLLMLVLKLVMVTQKQVALSQDAETGNGLKQQYQKLMSILERELLDLEDLDVAELLYKQDLRTTSMRSVLDKIKQLEDRQGKSPITIKNFQYNVNERYPESISHDSLFDFENTMNLPTVPEGLTIQTASVLPQASSNPSALRNLRRVKQSLQKVEDSEFEDEENEVAVKEYTLDPDYDSSGAYRRQTPLQTNLINISEETTESPDEVK